MKILLIAGHGAGQPGAVGNGYREVDLTREVVSMLKPKLDGYATVDIYPTSNNAFQDVQKGRPAVNFANYDYVLEIHFNAGDGVGTEIYVTSKEAKYDVEQNIMNSMSKLYKNRGVKRTDFLVISEAKRRGVSSALLEVCFIDNVSDMNIYATKKDEVVQSIADGIIGGFGLKQTVKPTPAPSKPTTSGEAVDQILHVGSKIELRGIYKISAVSARLNAIACVELADKPFADYNYIDATPCVEVDKNGNRTADQVCDVNHYIKIPGVFTVLAIDKPTDACKVKIGSREVWIKCGPCTEV